MHRNPVPNETPTLASVDEIIAETKAGRMFILTDDEDRENEGDLVFPAEFVTPEVINFMAHFGCGLICLALAPEIVERLKLPMMTQHNEARFGTPFTVSIEARTGVTTGISAADRAHTIRTAIDPSKSQGDIVSPGHVFPLKANPNGVLGRRGQTEGSVDIMRLAGLTPAAVICEVIKDDGTMARMQDLVSFAKIHKMKIGTISSLAFYRQGIKTTDKKAAR